MFRLKPIIFLVFVFVFVFVLFILDRFYILPIYLPLDTKPQGIWSAGYLAKSIARKAGCTIDFVGDGVYWEENATAFFCTIPNTSIDFVIHAFSNKKLRDSFMLNKAKSSTCFKKGSYYVVCGVARVTIGKLNKSYIDQEPKLTNTHTQIVYTPLIDGAKYYQQFPGEDLIYTNNKTTNTITKKDSHHVHTK